MKSTRTLAVIIQAVSPESICVPSAASTVCGTPAASNPRTTAMSSLCENNLFNIFICCVSVEAQTMEIPVIASDIGGSIETIVNEKSGFLFKSNDSKSLADTISMVMEKDYNSLKSIGFEGRKNILKKFDVDKMCQTTFTEYKKLIELS